MNNNDILRRIRYTFDFNDRKVIALFAAGAGTVTREQISAWLKRDDDPAFRSLPDAQLATFLNGFIVHRRGERDGAKPVPEKRLNNNIILRKIKIALNLKDEDILRLLSAAGHRLSKPELSAFFRKPGHKHYRECLDQVLRNFLKGMQIEYRVDAPSD